MPRNTNKSITIRNLNDLLEGIYKEYIALDKDEFEMYYGLFTDVFNQIRSKMKTVDPYFNKYSSNVVGAGSHYDRLRISTPDEFDVDIVIGLPLNTAERGNPCGYNSDVNLGKIGDGFMTVRMGTQYQSLMGRDGDDIINQQAYAWRDEKGYLLRSKFQDWFKGVVDKALNLFNEGSTPIIQSDGVPYTVRRSESGPAITLVIENKSHGIELNVDLVPALKFPEERWPASLNYRKIHKGLRSPEGFWLLVPKPHKNARNHAEMSRAWGIDLTKQERELMYDSQNLRQAVRLLKKLRDAEQMHNIASYYLKTLALQEAKEKWLTPHYWNQNPAELFKILVRRFHSALLSGKLRCYWVRRCNLFKEIKNETLALYANRLESLLRVLDQPDADKHVAKYLLTPDEFDNLKFLYVT